MIRHSPLTRSVCLELTQQEGRTLLDFVRRLPTDPPEARAGDKRRAAAVEETLGDAQTVAVWLHENVHWDIDRQPALGLLATMTAALAHNAPPCSHSLSFLLTVKRKLVDAVGRPSLKQSRPAASRAKPKQNPLTFALRF